jgi:3-methylfumaryl-CoA hydratase
VSDVEPADAVIREETIAAEPVEAMAGLLDIAMPRDGDVPELWHCAHLLERPASRDLGADGHPITGIPAPPSPGLRRMFAGGRVETHGRLRIGEPATRTTRLVADVAKQGRSGPLRFVTVRHEIRQRERLVVLEEQDLVYREPGPAIAVTPGEGLPSREASLSLDVDERLLFRFSALTYNAHRIHYDRAWCRQEGYDDLVVHGPLQALLMGELLRRNGVTLTGRRFSYRLVSPMIGPQTVHALASAEGLAAGAEVRTTDGRATALAAVVPGP